MYHVNRWRRELKRGIVITGLLCLLMLALSLTSFGQDDYGKRNHKHQYATYKKHVNRLSHACSILNKKHNHIPHRPLLAWHKKARPSMAERSVLQIDKADVTADASSNKVIVKPVARQQSSESTDAMKPQLKKEPKVEYVSEERLADLHKKENEVLANNNLPLPTSDKQVEVRKKVADKLASKTNVYPLTLDPLYFQFNQDEFSVVDMEPFLMAAEYALQGRTVLIEGHTDSRGQDDFNMKLSIKRVQKIRQLMLDMGVPDERISIVGYGEELSDKKTQDENDHQRSRRVDFTVF